MTENERYLALMDQGEFRNVFVFGSNLAGRHGLGAALAAASLYGARRGVGVGPMGDDGAGGPKCYAIPTKDHYLRPLPEDAVRAHVRDFVAYATQHPELRFILTRVGAGLARNSDATMAQMFADAPENVIRPLPWTLAALVTPDLFSQ